MSVNGLEPRLNIVLEEWKKWQTENHLSALDESLLTDAYEKSNITQAKKKLLKKDDRQIPLSLEEPVQTKNPNPSNQKFLLAKHWMSYSKEIVSSIAQRKKEFEDEFNLLLT